MTKFKVGDRVRYLGSCGCDIPVGTICIIDEESVYPEYHTEDKSHVCCADQDSFELIKGGTMEDLKYGDVLERDVYESKVLVTINQGEQIVLLSQDNNFERCSAWYTLVELENYGYKLKDPSDTVEMTVEEVSEAIGKTVKIVKGKK